MTNDHVNSSELPDRWTADLLKALADTKTADEVRAVLTASNAVLLPERATFAMRKAGSAARGRYEYPGDSDMQMDDYHQVGAIYEAMLKHFVDAAAYGSGEWSSRDDLVWTAADDAETPTPQTMASAAWNRALRDGFPPQVAVKFAVRAAIETDPLRIKLQELASVMENQSREMAWDLPFFQEVERGAEPGSDEA